MIQRDHYNGPISFSCDGCPEATDTHCSDFTSALAKARSRGWKARKADGEWQHFCPDCASEEE